MSQVDFSRLPQPVVADHPEWVALYGKAWELAARSIRRGKQGSAYMDAAWDRDLNYQWVWDTCFMALYCRYGAGQYPGVESLDNFYRLQRDDGYISMTYSMDTGQEPWTDRLNPPLFAWAEWEHYRSTDDASRLERACGHIEKLMDWIEKNRRTAPHRRRRAVDGPKAGVGQSTDNFQLYWFDDGGSSGMDDSPRSPRLKDAGRFFDWIDMSCQVALSYRMLGQMRAVLGQAAAAEQHARRAAEIGALINDELWCPRTRFYHDRMIPTNFMASKTVAGFWPLVTGFCPPERVAALVEHLGDERSFNRPTPVPSLSADDPNYDPKGTYWVGGVWAPTNYMVTRGLMQAGRGDVAHQIAAKYLGVLARTWAGHDPQTLWECYSPEADAPGLAAYTQERVKPNFVGWTGLGPIAMLIENILGLDADVAAGKVAWTIRLAGEHGLRNLSLGQRGRASFLCAARRSVAEPARVEIASDADLTVTLQRGTQLKTLRVEAGKTARADV